MPPPIPVELHRHDPAWAERARQEAARLAAAVGPAIVAVHHIGSTAIPGIRAKPILDLMPVVRNHAKFEGRRAIQLHCYERGSPEIVRHLAFRDCLRSRPALARAYDAEKGRCRDLHPLDSHAYTDCTDAWIRRVEAQALSAADLAGRT